MDSSLPSTDAAEVREDRYRQIVEASPSPIFSVDGEGRVVSCNDACTECLGYTAAEMRGRPVDGLLPEGDRARVHAYIADAFAGKRHSEVELTLCPKSGPPFFALSRIYPVGDASGVTECVFANTDVTERRRMEQALARRERRYRELREQAADGIAVFEMRGRFCEVNRRLCEMTGFAEEELLRMGPADLIVPASLEKTPLLWDELELDRTLLVERELRRADGGTVLVEVSLRKVDEGFGQAILRDIRQRKAAERERRQSDTQFRLIAEHTTDFIVLHEPGGRVIYASPSWRLLDYDPAALVGRHPLELVHPDDRPRIEAVMKRLEEGAPYEHYTCRVARGELRAPSGEAPHHVVLETNASTIKADDGTVLRWVCTSRDVTERVEAQAQLRRTADHLHRLNQLSRTILQDRPLRDILLDAVTSIATDVPVAHLSVVEYVPEREVIRELAVSRGGQTAIERGEELPVGTMASYEQLRRGETFRVDDLLALDDPSPASQILIDQGARAIVGAPLRIGARFVGALFLVHTATGYFTDELVGRAKRYADLLAVAVWRDKMEAERTARQAELVRARDRAEEMSRVKTAFLANMSHEIRTPLTAIIGFADVLADEVEGPGRQFAELIRRSGERLKETLNSVLDLAQLESRALQLDLEPLQAARVVEDVAVVMRAQAAEKGLELRTAIPEGLCLHADAAALGRILTNLIANAIKFTPEGHVAVRASQAGDQVELRVEDTGIGIGPAFLPQIFDDFKQESTGLRRTHEGSGLGLTITRHLVELMGGTIRAESEQGAGSVFVFTLPSCSPEETGAGTAEGAERAADVETAAGRAP